MPHHLLLRGSRYQLPGNHTKPPHSSFLDLAKAGISTLEVDHCLLNPKLIDQISQAGLSLIIQATPLTSDDITATITLAKQTRAQAINIHISGLHNDNNTATQLISSLIAIAADANIPLYFETRRNSMTHDISNTARLAEAVPEMRFTLDASHYIQTEEDPGPTPIFSRHLEIILDRTEMLNGCMPNGQPIQQNPLKPKSDIAEIYKSVWTEAMRRWRLRKPAGSTLIFTPWVITPTYEITNPEGKDLSNTNEQTESIWQIAQSAWKQSAG